MTDVPYPAYNGDEPCRFTDPEAFFQDFFGPYVVKALTAICNNCAMKQMCAEYAIAHEIEGFWGGMTPSERNRVRRRRNITVRQTHLDFH